MPTTTQLVISGLSKPGVLAQVAQVLGEAKVNIKAFSAPEVAGTGKLRLLVADLEEARAALKAATIKFTEETALLLSLENKPGALKEVADLLNKARINIKCGYCTPSREGKRAIVVLTVSNTEKALTILQRSIARRVLDMSRGPRSCRSCWPVLLFATLFVGALDGCSGTPKPTYFPGYPVGFVERGVASWYGPGFHGNKTANGERYDMHQLTAAHRTLPLGSIAVVRSMSTGRQVTVRINDRGPFARGRVLDLSLAGAQALGMTGAGTERD